jgi:NAD dependent epimerase/dehydratase family enzyme
MEIFIKGATGLKGKQVVNLLSKTEHEPFWLIRKSSRLSRIPESPRIKLSEGDIREK